MYTRLIKIHSADTFVNKPLSIYIKIVQSNQICLIVISMIIKCVSPAAEELLDQQPRAPRYDPYNTGIKSYDCSQTPLEKDKIL